jgi:hypothetical protein
MARREEPKTSASNDQASAKMIWTLQDHQRDFPCGILASVTFDMDNI